MAPQWRGKVSGDLAMASARDMPSMTRSCTCFHFSAATGEDASLQRITSARLSGTPAASRLESKRVKFSNSFEETFCEPNLKKNLSPAGALPFLAGTFLGAPFLAEPFFAEARSERLTGRRP